MRDRKLKQGLAARVMCAGIAVVISASCVAADKTAGKNYQEYKELPVKYCGAMTPYDFSRCDSTVAWPDSLKPVYLGYVARHGARYLTGPKKIELISTALHDAEAKGKLTAAGRRLLSVVREVSRNTDGRWGLLSPVGIAEEQRLGKDMAAMLPGLFRKGELAGLSTYVPRVIMTMYQFMHALEIPNKNLALSTFSGRACDSLLRGFSFDKEYARYRDNGAWKPIYDKFVLRHVSDAPARRLFAAGYETDRGRLCHLTMSMYGLFQGNAASGLPLPTTEFMSQEEFRGCWLASNMIHYLRNNITPVSGLAAKATAPLLRRIVDDADAALQGGDVRANGYFGHAETLLPLLSLMRMPGCYVMTEDYVNLPDRWQVQEITPLGANIAIVLLKGKSGEAYVSVRLNGRNMEPMPGKGTVVRWRELRDYWLGLASVTNE